MAKSGVYEGDPTANITTLKKELQRLVKSIIDDEHNNGFEFIDQATQTLINLKRLKSSSLDLHVGVDTCPQEFKCPVSNEVMRDPGIGFMGVVYIRQKEAAKTLRSFTKRIPSFRAFFSECSDAITQLLGPLSQNKKEIHLDLQEDLITTLLNLSILDNNKKLVAETPIVITILLDALRSGTIETRSNAAATLFTLSALDSNKSLIGKAGALKPLIDLLDEGHALAMKDAASAIFNLCIIHENKGRAVRDGAINVLLNKIEDRVQVDELLSILAMLSSNQKAIEDMCDLGAVSCLFSLMRETTCARNKENCVAILYTICFNDRTKWKEMREEESTYGTLSQLAQDGTLRAKRKAEGLLDRINRPMNRTHTA
ncbi:U-box domain-containing protein 9-like protein [Tanacetum coccineum]